MRDQNAKGWQIWTVGAAGLFVCSQLTLFLWAGVAEVPKKPGRQQFPAGIATCPGDTNLDDQLDFGDLLLLSKHLLTPSLEGTAL